MELTCIKKYFRNKLIIDKITKYSQKSIFRLEKIWKKLEKMQKAESLSNAKKRAVPIPKEVNHFVLKNFGEKYYRCKDFNEKIQILKNIEAHLKTSGFNITWNSLERRLKNMKSHYRRKKTELGFNISSNICWEYYDELDRIFTRTSSDDEGDENETLKPAAESQAITSTIAETSVEEVPLKTVEHTVTPPASLTPPLPIEITKNTPVSMEFSVPFRVSQNSFRSLLAMTNPAQPMTTSGTMSDSVPVTTPCSLASSAPVTDSKKRNHQESNVKPQDL